VTELTKQAIGAVAFVLNVWGNLELTKQTNRGHIIRLCSNACWLIYSPLVGAWALFVNHGVFAAINVLGFYRWRQIEKRHPPHGAAPCAACAAREQELADRLARQT
jgi:Bacterial inner membrane protein